MVNEEKVRMMTKISRNEKKLGEKMVTEGGFYKSDYIISHILNAIYSITLGYLLVLFLIALYHIDYIFLNFVELNYVMLACIVLFLYVLIIIITSVLSYLHYQNRYIIVEKDMKNYYNELKELEEYYTGDGKGSVDDSITDN